jgi:integrase/recombinase XerD
MVESSNRLAPPRLHPQLVAYLEHLRLADREQTARTYEEQFRPFQRWLDANHRDALACTVDDLQAYQRAVAEVRQPDGRPLSASTQAIRLGAVRAVFVWLEQQGHILSDPSRPLRLPKKASGTHVTTAYLDLQELVAVLTTAAAQADRHPVGCWKWAEAVRLLAVITVAVFTGRRRAGILFLRVGHLDLDRREVRIEKDKGQAGMVVPITSTAVDVLRLYRDKARPVLNNHHGNDYLFTGDHTPIFCHETLWRQFGELIAAAAEANSDLSGLRTKKLTFHSCRVTYATTLFQQGASLRWINELLQHAQMNTTSRYAVTELEQLRSACQTAHPRA